MRRDIKNQYGAIIGFSKEDKSRIEYYLLIGGMIGFWDKRTQRYIAIGKGGGGMKAQSDIGVGEVYRLSINANREYKKKEQETGVNMKYMLKQKIQGGYKKTEYEITAKALPKLIAHAKKVRAELFDETGKAIDLENDGKAQMLMAAIKDEWETIQSYEGSLSAFTPDEQAVIKDIIMEEKVHIGQLQSMLDNIGKTVTEPITEGTEEGESQLGTGAESDEDIQDMSPIAKLNAMAAAYKARRKASTIVKNVKSAYTSDYDYNYLVTNLDRSSHSYLFKYAVKQVEYWAKYDPDKANRYGADVDEKIRYFNGKVYNGYTRGEVTREQMQELKDKAIAEGEAVKDYISDLISGTYDSAPFAMVKASRDSRSERNITRRQAGRGYDGIKEVADDYIFNKGDIVVWTNDGVIALADSVEDAEAVGATPDGAVSYFIYGIDKEVTENFEQCRNGDEDIEYWKEDHENNFYASKTSKRMKADIRPSGEDQDYIDLFIDGKKFPNRIKETVRHEYRFKTSNGTWIGSTANEVVTKILADDYGIIGNVEEAWFWENMGVEKWSVKTDVGNNSKGVETSKKRVKCSIGEIIEKEILSEDKAKEAYALGFRDAIEKADEVESLGEHPNLDMERDVEFDEDDPNSAEQAIYDAGVAEVEEYSDENNEFDNDVFEEEAPTDDEDEEKDNEDDNKDDENE